MSYGVIIGVGAATWLFYQWILFLKTKSKVSGIRKVDPLVCSFCCLPLHGSQVKDIPTVGADGFITSYISGWKFFFKGHEMLQEGYDKVGRNCDDVVVNHSPTACERVVPWNSIQDTDIVDCQPVDDCLKWPTDDRGR